MTYLVVHRPTGLPVVTEPPRHPPGTLVVPGRGLARPGAGSPGRARTRAWLLGGTLLTGLLLITLFTWRSGPLESAPPLMVGGGLAAAAPAEPVAGAAPLTLSTPVSPPQVVVAPPPAPPAVAPPAAMAAPAAATPESIPATPGITDALATATPPVAAPVARSIAVIPVAPVKAPPAALLAPAAPRPQLRPSPPVPAPRPRITEAHPSAPRPSPPKPNDPARAAWLPALKPWLPPTNAIVVAALIGPAPAKPGIVAAAAAARDLDHAAIMPAAGPGSAPAVGLASAIPVAVNRGRPIGAAASDGVRVTDHGTSLTALDRAAREALRAGRPDQAVTLYEEILAVAGHHRGAALGRATALQQLGDRRAAIAAYQTVLENHPDELAAQIALAGLTAEQAPEQGLRRLEHLARRNPDSSRIFAQIGTILARMNHLDHAIPALRRAVQLEPDNLRYQAELAIALDRAGQRVAAASAYRNLLRASAHVDTTDLPLDAMAQRLRHLTQRRS